MSRLPLDSTPLGTNTTNGTTSHINSIPVGTKTPEPTPLTQPTEFPNQKWENAHTRGTGSRPIIVRLIIENLIRRRIAIAVN